MNQLNAHIDVSHAGGAKHRADRIQTLGGNFQRGRTGASIGLPIGARAEHVVRTIQRNLGHCQIAVDGTQPQECRGGMASSNVPS